MKFLDMGASQKFPFFFIFAEQSIRDSVYCIVTFKKAESY